MAIHLVVACKDQALDAFANPFVVPTVAIALRSFKEECKNKDSPLRQHPSDFSLYVLGEFDARTGALTSQVPQRIAGALEFVGASELTALDLE